MEHQVEVPYRHGYEYGMGVDSASGSPMGCAIVGTPTNVRDAPGGSGSFLFTRVETTSDLEEHLGISADLSGGVGLFSASDRFTFAKNCKVQTSSITLLIHCTREYGFEQIDTPEIEKDHAAPLVADGKDVLFQARYGDRFVRGMTSGGQFFGILRIDVKTEQARSDIENTLSGTYGLAWSADIAAKVTSTLQSTNSEARAFVYYEGGELKTIPTTPEQVYAAATEWLQSLDANRKPYQVTLSPYIIAAGPNPPNPEQLQHQRDVLVRCAQLRSRTIDNINLIDYMTDTKHANDFEAVPDGLNLAELSANLNRDLDLIAEAASFAIDNPTEALSVEDFARKEKKIDNYTITLLPLNLPKLKPGAAQPPQKSTPVTPVDPNYHSVDPRFVHQYVDERARRLSLNVLLKKNE
jgi:hypothetical protein